MKEAEIPGAIPAISRLSRSFDIVDPLVDDISFPATFRYSPIHSYSWNYDRVFARPPRNCGVSIKTEQISNSEDRTFSSLPLTPPRRRKYGSAGGKVDERNLAR